MGKEKYTKYQKIWMIVFSVYTISMIVFVCLMADLITDLSLRRKIVLILLIPFFIILFFYSGVPSVCFPTKKNTAMIIKSRFSFLENFGYWYSRYAYNKKQKSLEIYFVKPDFVDICVVHFFKYKVNNVYMIVGDEFVSFRNLEDMYCEKLSDEERTEMSIEEYIEYVVSGVFTNKDEILRIQSCCDFKNKL